MTLKEDVKLHLRITTDAYDSEVDLLIGTARALLKVAGVSAVIADAVEPVDLIKSAIMAYSKANFGMDNPDRQELNSSFDRMASTASMATEYQGPSV